MFLHYRQKSLLFTLVLILFVAVLFIESTNSYAQSFSQEAIIDTSPQNQDENSEDNKNKQNSDEEKVVETPITKWIEAENSLVKDLSATDQETFFIIRNKHSVIRSLRVVRDDIGSAVKACSTENPAIKEEMNTRFSDWKNAVEPILKEADKFLRREIKSQKVVSSREFRNILNMNDTAYEFSSAKIEKRPVTDEKSCKKLLASMDRTENELIALLQNILLPEEVVRERLEQQKKKEASSKKDS